jgi:hypothetical protein
LQVQDGATTTLPFERDLDDAEVQPFLDGYGDGIEAVEEGLVELEAGRTYDTERENEAYDSGANFGLAAGRWSS